MQKIFISRPCPIVINSQPNVELSLESVVEDGVTRRVQKVVPFKGNSQKMTYKAFSPDILIANGETKPIVTYMGTSLVEKENAVSDFNERLGEAMNESSK